ncbi:Hypothetical predicted protein [Cloeon dipterum]|uniref:Uncharacterized protein n=1 Tax=Cloeon dipterum TaxID=197152 RepID=A0A8S1DH56_9INSE|nr:Hypothetical predicted protein [Cloeon dipterum]
MLISAIAEISSIILSSISMSIKEIAAYAGNKIPNFKDNIDELRQDFALLCDCVESINELFSPLTVFFVPSTFFMFLNNLCCFVVAILDLDPMLSEMRITLSSGCWILMMGINVGYLCCRCQSFKNEIINLRRLLYRLEMETESSDFREQVNFFNDFMLN